MRGPGLEPHVADTDPQRTGVPPLPARATQPGAQATADLFNRWIAEARKVIADHPKANALTLRGFSTDPELPRFPEVFGVRSACVAVYPMYKGVAELVGMAVLKVEGDRPEDEFAALAKGWNDFDFFFVHIKKTDSRGEDGDFAAKSAVIEAVDCSPAEAARARAVRSGCDRRSLDPGEAQDPLLAPGPVPAVGTGHRSHG